METNVVDHRNFIQNFQEDLANSRRFPGFPGVVDTLSRIKTINYRWERCLGCYCAALTRQNSRHWTGAELVQSEHGRSPESRSDRRWTAVNCSSRSRSASAETPAADWTHSSYIRSAESSETKQATTAAEATDRNCPTMPLMHCPVADGQTHCFTLAR